MKTKSSNSNTYESPVLDPKMENIYDEPKLMTDFTQQATVRRPMHCTVVMILVTLTSILMAASAVILVTYWFSREGFVQKCKHTNTQI